MGELVKELLEFFADLATGKITIDKARERAKKYHALLEEKFSDVLLADMDKRLAELEGAPPDPSDR